MENTGKVIVSEKIKLALLHLNTSIEEAERMGLTVKVSTNCSQVGEFSTPVKVEIYERIDF